MIPKKVVLTCLRLGTSCHIYQFWSLSMHSNSSSNFFLRPLLPSAPFNSERARCCVHLSDSSKGVFLNRSNFFADETKKVVLTCLRLETRSNNYYFWNFTINSKSSSKLFLRPWCTSAPFYFKGARYSVHVSDSSVGVFWKEESFFTDETKRVVLTCIRLGTCSNIHYFWIFTMHSLSSSNFFLRSWCTSTPFFSERARHSLHLSDTSMGYISKRGNFFRDETKKCF